MKKIITLIMMFVLSVSFLMAQEVFTYQTMVVDNNGVLLVNERVSGTVTITDGIADHIYTKTFNGKTSPNGMLTLSLEDDEDEIFKAINWQNAQIAVTFDDEGAKNYTETIPAVPYALQAGSNELTTQMIVDYLTAPNTGKYDVDVIWNVLKANPDFDQVIAALVDSVKNNRLAAKEIFLHYMENAEVEDAEALYNALLQGMANEGVKDAMMEVAKKLIKSNNNKEKIYDVLSAYSTQLTANDVNRLIDAVPAEVIDTLVEIAVEYLKDPDHFATFLDVFGDYLKNVTVPEVDQLISALQNNAPVYAVMLEQFYEWMDEYVAKVAADMYYAKTCGEGPNATITADELCALANGGTTTTCLQAQETFSMPTQLEDQNYYYTATVIYGGTGTLTLNNISEVLRIYNPGGYEPTTGTGSWTQEDPVSNANYRLSLIGNGEYLFAISADYIEEFFTNVFASNPAGDSSCTIRVTFSNVDCLGPNETQPFDIYLIYEH